VLRLASNPRRLTVHPPSRWLGVVLCAALAIPGVLADAAAGDYPRVSKRIPANPFTYVLADRPHGGLPIDSVMIHDTETSYAGTVFAFTKPNADASVHYVVSGQNDSNDPAVTQFVIDQDWSFSVANYWYNERSIGVEHIGFAAAPAGYYTPLLYQRSADLVGWVAWKYRIPVDRAHILGHDNIPLDQEQFIHDQHWDPGPAWDWPYYMKLVRAAYGRWSRNRPLPRPELPARFTKLSTKIRAISVGSQFDGTGDVIDWTTGLHNSFTNVYADRNGRPVLGRLVRGASDPSTYVPSATIGADPTFSQRDFSCDSFPWSIIPNAPAVLSQVAIGDLRAKAAWGQEFALLGRARVGGVLYDKINFSGTVGWILDSDTSAGWGALVRFRGGSHPTTLFSAPADPAHTLGRTLDTRICPDAQFGFSRRGQTYVARVARRVQGRMWYQIDYNHRVAWVPSDAVVVTAAMG
jgi:N-acetyl-anhydromuramyl-L-alanine amidase AmpD